MERNTGWILQCLYKGDSMLISSPALAAASPHPQTTPGSKQTKVREKGKGSGIPLMGFLFARRAKYLWVPLLRL